MRHSNPIPIEGTNLSFYTTYDDENGWGFVIMNVPTVLKNSNNGLASEKDGQDAAIKRAKEIWNKRKRFYIYDLHEASLIYDIINQIEAIYEVIKIDSLNQITDQEGILEITPLCIKNEHHWEEIRNFLSTNTCHKVLMMVQDECKEKVEQLVGHHQNVTILDRDHVFNFDEVMDQIFKGN